jgi:hypothetical protein
MGFDGCYFEDIDRACVYIPSRSGQAKALRFQKCAFVRSPFGILHETGSFTTFGCAFGYLTEAAIRLRSITDYIAINETDSEGCARFLVTDGGSSASWAVKINGARFALNGLVPDGRYIDFTNGGPLLIDNCLFEDAGTPRPFRIRAHSAEPGAVVIAIGNTFPNDTPFDLGGRCRLVALGNRGRDAARRPTNLDDVVTAGTDAGGRLALSTVSTISATATCGRNLRGSVTITGRASKVHVTFDQAEPDGRYYVAATVAGIHGQPSWDARHAMVEGKSRTGFAVVLQAAPGPENAVTVDWILIR